MEHEVKNDLNIELLVDGIEVEVRYRNVTWAQALHILGTYAPDQVKTFTWE
jgi:hypothetical protein